MRNLILDGKIRVQEKIGELSIEKQKAAADLGAARKESVQLEGARQRVKSELPLLGNEWEAKLKEQEQFRGVIRTSHRKIQKQNEQTIEKYVSDDRIFFWNLSTVFFSTYSQWRLDHWGQGALDPL